MNSSANRGEFEIGVDIGGTFTDWVLWRRDKGVVRSGKILTQTDLASGFLTAIDAATDGIDKRAIATIRHGTTVATNALLQGTTPPLVLFTTKGFRDLLEIGRQFRHDLYNLGLQRTAPLVPREARV